MIKEFKELPCRDSAIIYQSCFEQIKMLFEVNPQLAGELAISIIEMALCGEISSDDYTIKIIAQGFKPLFSKNKDKYEKEIKSKKIKQITELKLKEIASLILQKYTQEEIGKELGISQQTVSYRLKIIYSDYPELLESANTKNTKELNFCNFGTNLYSSKNFIKNESNSDILPKIPKLPTKPKIQTLDNDNVNDNVNENVNDTDTVSENETVSDTVSVSDTGVFRKNFEEEQIERTSSAVFDEEENERAYYLHKANLKGTITLPDLEGKKFDYLGKYKNFIRLHGYNEIYELIK